MIATTMEDQIRRAGHLTLAIEHWQGEADRLRAETERMRDRIERLRGMLKTNAGWWYALSDDDKGDACMEVSGDMEPPIMGPNDKAQGGEPAGEASPGAPG